MNLYRILMFFFLACSKPFFAQEKLNEYQYLLIPEQLKLQNEPNQYKINKILKDYFNKHDFKTFIQGDHIPSHINPCNMLNLNADKSGFLSTKIVFTFSDCYGKKVYSSIEGTSRIKEFKSAYYEALRGALKDPNIQQHKFVEKENAIVGSVELNHHPIVTDVAFLLEFKNIVYTFKNTKVKDVYVVLKDDIEIGVLKKQNDIFVLDTENLKGTGSFDDFGNFSLIRTNPVNNATITDVMARVK